MNVSKRFAHVASLLGSLKNVPTSYKRIKRVGRGPGSGHGKTSGRGQKGQNSRSGGGVKPFFEGGQTPITKAFPKRGFVNPYHRPMVPLNLNRVQGWINQGRLGLGTEAEPLTMEDLLRSKCIHRIHPWGGVKLLARGASFFNSKIYIKVSRVSGPAIKIIEKLGGKVTSVYYNRLGLDALLRPHKYDFLPKQALPTRKNDVDYYKDKRKRGYLADLGETVA